MLKLKEVIQKEINGTYVDLVTRQVGRVVFSKLESEIKGLAEGTVLVIDFSGIGAIDYSCADEIFAKLISRLQLNEYGEKYIAFKNLTSGHKENIQIVLEKKDLAVLIREKNGWDILGALDDYLLQTLKVIMKEGQLSSSELSVRFDLALNTASMRLSNLSKLRLVSKKSSVNTVGKRCFIYNALLDTKN
ncbi:MAG: STAS-like domain-containing protein [Candidatus Omnitrophica bacterium]|nr:STAS-like domain-containing protein [Candidatus Omnitrophota bacterium]